jgi:hypothetical protein
MKAGDYAVIWKQYADVSIDGYNTPDGMATHVYSDALEICMEVFKDKKAARNCVDVVLVRVVRDC